MDGIALVKIMNNTLSKFLFPLQSIASFLVLFVATLLISCNSESNPTRNEPLKEKLGINEDSLMDKDSVNIHIADGVSSSKLREETVGLLTDFLMNYLNPSRLINLYDVESREYIHNTFSSYHIWEFLEEDAFITYKPTLLSIYTMDTDTIAKVSFNNIDSLGNTNLEAIFNFGLTYSKSELLLKNMVMVNSKGWVHRKVGVIEYIFPDCYNFSEQNANRMIEFNRELSELFKVEPFDYRYYITANEIELQKLRGIDYLVNMYSMNNSTGAAEAANNLIFAGNGSEYYPHELVHLFVRKWIGANSYHLWFDEGLATLLGGSGGMGLDYHLGALAEYSKNNSIDFSDVLNCRVQISDTTGFMYAVGGLLCKLAFEKGGIELVKVLFLAGKTDENFYEAIESVLGVKQEDLNQYILLELEPYSL